jgi:glycosyltransferase involved in cell wall biosynthesis
MRILLAATASYAPPRGGATRSNLVWLDRLARAGHACRIVCGASAPGAEMPVAQSIALVAVPDPIQRVQALRREIAGMQPDWVLVSSEDLGHGLLREAHHSAPGRVVYLAHTPQFFPFGPASWNPEPRAAEMVAQAAGIVAIGRHMAAYIERALGRAAAVIHPPIYGGAGPWPASGSLITMINPCAVKGISIFVDVARSLRAVEFGAVPGWGTTAEDLAAMRALPNVTLLQPARDIDDLLARTRVLLMPSLWYEGFGLIVMEAMLRGIPVVSSDSGGLAEAKRGTGYVIPARTIERYEPLFDELAMPRPVVPANDAGPWVAAIEELLGDPTAYQREAAASRAAAEAFVVAIDGTAMERYLEGLRPSPDRAGHPAYPTIESLSPAQRALLLERLRRRAGR